MTPDEAAIEEVATSVAAVASTRSAGRCIRVSDLPFQLADGACSRAAALVNSDDVVCLVTTNPTRHGTPNRQRSSNSAMPRRLARLRTLGHIRPGLASAWPRKTASASQPLRSCPLLMSIRTSSIDCLPSWRRRDTDVAEITAEVVAAAKGNCHSGVAAKRVANYLAAVVTRPTPGGSRSGVAAPRSRAQYRVRRATHARGATIDGFSSNGPAEWTSFRNLRPPAERVRENRPLDPDDRQDREVLRALLEAVADGTVDPFEIARRLGEDGAR